VSPDATIVFYRDMDEAREQSVFLQSVEWVFLHEAPNSMFHDHLRRARSQNLMPQGFHLVRWFATLVAIVLQLAACGLPITHVHPYFGPTYGDGGG